VDRRTVGEVDGDGVHAVLHAELLESFPRPVERDHRTADRKELRHHGVPEGSGRARHDRCVHRAILPFRCDAC
jgi:hypothetical protein